MSTRTALVTHAIDAQTLLREVSAEAHGATSLFLGTVRDLNDGRAVAGIEYAAYAAMASAELARIASEAAQQFGIASVAVEHRIGQLELGEVSVAIAVSHTHRAPALDATRYIIEELKKRVPIWKRERYADGEEEWVDPTLAARSRSGSTEASATSGFATPKRSTLEPSSVEGSEPERSSPELSLAKRSTMRHSPQDYRL